MIRNIIRLDGSTAYKEDNSERASWPRTFAGGNALFYSYMFIEAYASFLNEMDEDWGLLPFPKGPHAGNYICGMDINAKIMGLMANNPDIDKAAFVLNALAKQGMREVELDMDNLADRHFRDDESLEVINKIRTEYMYVDPYTLTCVAEPWVWEGTRAIISRVARFDDSEPTSEIEGLRDVVINAMADYWTFDD